MSCQVRSGFWTFKVLLSIPPKKGTQYDARTSQVANRNIVENSVGRMRMFPQSMWSFSTVSIHSSIRLVLVESVKSGSRDSAMIANAAHHLTGKRIRQL